MYLLYIEIRKPYLSYLLFAFSILVFGHNFDLAKMVVVTILNIQSIKVLVFFERNLEMFTFFNLHVVKVPKSVMLMWKIQCQRKEIEKVYHLTSGAGSPRTFIWKKVLPPIWAFLSFNSLMHLGIANSSKAVRKKKWMDHTEYVRRIKAWLEG